jgi:hypothetical protein
MQQGRANRVSDNIMRLCDADLSSIWKRGSNGDEGLTAEQFDRFILMCRSGFVSAEDSFLQHLSGQLDGTAFKSFTVAARAIFALPGTRAAWRLSSKQYGDEFEKFMEGIVKATPVWTRDNVGSTRSTRKKRPAWLQPCQANARFRPIADIHIWFAVSARHSAQSDF